MGQFAEHRRSELLQSGGNFTLSELNEFGKGPEIKDESGTDRDKYQPAY